MTYQELIEASKALSERLATQDNAATAHPIFYVEERDRIYGMDFEEFDGDHVWTREDDCTNEADADEAAALEARRAETGGDPIDGWKRLGYIDKWRVVQPFLTRTGAEEYIADQRHNLSRPRVYVGSGHRNREWQHARTALPALVQGLEDALRVVAAARAWHTEMTGGDEGSSCELCAALAHFDAREQAQP